MTAADQTVLLAEGESKSLWDFAVSVYGQESVEQACLALQNRLGADVNMVMFCLWLAARGGGSGDGADLARFLGAALKLSRDWQRLLVEPLRACRLNLKEFTQAGRGDFVDQGALSNLRDHVKKCELEAERLQIVALASLVEGEPVGAPGPVASRRQRALGNLDVYFSATGVKLDPLGQTHVARILDAAFGR